MIAHIGQKDNAQYVIMLSLGLDSYNLLFFFPLIHLDHYLDRRLRLFLLHPELIPGNTLCIPPGMAEQPVCARDGHIIVGAL